MVDSSLALKYPQAERLGQGQEQQEPTPEENERLEKVTESLCSHY